MADKYKEYDQIYTDGSLKDDKVGFFIVTNNQIIKKRMKSQSSIYSAEQQAPSDHNGNVKYNTNKKNDDHSHGLS
jgi:hypothetical protein